MRYPAVQLYLSHSSICISDDRRFITWGAKLAELLGSYSGNIKFIRQLIDFSRCYDWRLGERLDKHSSFALTTTTPARQLTMDNSDSDQEFQEAAAIVKTVEELQASKSEKLINAAGKMWPFVALHPADN